jgi:hypothetical protein
MTRVVAPSKRTSIPIPVVMRLRLADGSTQDVTLPVDVWARASGRIGGTCESVTARTSTQSSIGPP